MDLQFAEPVLERANVTLPESFRNVRSLWCSVPHERVNPKYKFISTLDVVDTLAEAGWLPVKAFESKTRDMQWLGFQGHMVRFRNPTAIPKLHETFIELVVRNSHAGFTAFKFSAGLYRLVCSNGMVVGESTFQTKRITHMSYDADKVLAICKELADSTSMIHRKITAMKSTGLTRDDQLSFAKQAADLRGWKNVDPVEIYRPRREADKDQNVWTTYNVVQENMLKGGISLGRRKSREIVGISSDVSINQKLWELAEKFAHVN